MSKPNRDEMGPVLYFFQCHAWVAAWAALCVGIVILAILIEGIL